MIYKKEIIIIFKQFPQISKSFSKIIFSFHISFLDLSRRVF